MPNLQTALVEMNPWWEAGLPPDARPRELESILKPFLDTRMMVAFTGLRRVGKTTLLLRLARQAIEAGLPPKRVVFFSFEEFKQAEMRDVLAAWERTTGQPRDQGRLLILLDEVQKVPGWAEQTKVLYDRHRNFKFLLSGSESLFLRRDSTESLAGRLFEFQVHPLNFREYLDFMGEPREPLELRRAPLRKAVDGFLRCQGFPELLGIDEPAYIRKYIRETVVERVVFRDLPEILGLESPEALMSILNMLMDEPGQLLEVARVGKDLGLTRQSAAKYLRYLERAFLVRRLYNWSPQRRKVERKLKKYYPSVLSPSLVSNLNDAVRGRVLEWLVVNQARPSFFWRDSYKHEVDMVLDGPVPVEVKLSRPDTDGLAAFFRKHKARRGTIVTEDLAAMLKVDGRPVEVVPAYEFLLRLPPPEA